MKVITNKKDLTTTKSRSQIKSGTIKKQEALIRVYDQYFLSSWQRIFFARLLDIILVSIIPLILTLTSNSWNVEQSWWKLLIVIMITFFLFLFYFIIIPYYWKGQTLARFLLRIKLVCLEGKVLFWALAIRELLIIFLPWLCQLIASLAFYLIFKKSFFTFLNNNETNSVASVIMKLIISLYFFWYLGLFFAILINKNHQVLFDHHFKLFMVYSKMIVTKKHQKKLPVLIKSEQEHVHLGKNQPGNIDDDVLDDIDNL